MPDKDATSYRVPRVVIRGDIRLRVSESIAARKLVKGSYSIDHEGMHEPLQVIWITDGSIMAHSVDNVDIAFDLRGASAGETRTFLITVQVSDHNGRGSILHTSVFIQIHVTKDES